ncbi:hypothetical protein [Streptomyces sp. NPDC046821]|uniref:hypothetical protein n=1 Tax=Streptomyces sp. NPDC046821 TaxID=3154702 RepID=UPI0033C4E6C9
MTTWGLIVETTVGMGERKHMEASVLAHVEGSREEAMAELERRAWRYIPEHPRNARRRRAYRTADGILLVMDGSWQSFSTRFVVAELVGDSDAPPPEPEPVPAEVDPTPPAQPENTGTPSPDASVARYDDGVPVKPAWFGRTDLS